MPDCLRELTVWSSMVTITMSGQVAESTARPFSQSFPPSPFRRLIREQRGRLRLDEAVKPKAKVVKEGVKWQLPNAQGAQGLT
jgi:hypothetical protein